MNILSIKHMEVAVVKCSEYLPALNKVENKSLDKVETENKTPEKGHTETKTTKLGGKTNVTGLVRKTSIRRRLSTTELDKQETFGRKTEQYEKICSTIMADPVVTNSLEALRERWKMIMFMYDDTIDLINSRKNKILQRKNFENRRNLFATSIIYTSISLPLFVVVLTTVLLLFS